VRSRRLVEMPEYGPSEGKKIELRCNVYRNCTWLGRS